MKILIVIVIVVIIFAIEYARISANVKKGINSAEKQRVREIMISAVLNPENYTTVYGMWDVAYTAGGRNVRTTTTQYWYYGVAFGEDKLYVAPLSFSKGEINAQNILCIEKKDVSMVECEIDFKGKVASAVIYDKEMKKIVSFYAGANNTKDDRYHPVNIQQPDEADAFCNWLNQWQKEIHAENKVDMKVKEKAGSISIRKK